MKPRIGVTASSRSGWRIFPLVAFNIWLAGGKAVKWVTAGDVDIDAVHGVIIGGGDDISPDLYGGELVTSARLDPERDALEQNIARIAFEDGTPILGICRGSQMLNITLGGTLNQDAYSTYESRKYRTILPRKRVRLEPERRLSTICGPQEMRVNALHSQAVDTLGEGLAVAARDEGGMIQAIERVRDPFAIGVQWHPEHLFYARRQRSIFRALVTAARAYRESRAQLAHVDAEGISP
ncbi:gamma-glutamyl-gamma-aminobutyrate hydrolase family protein [Tropicimonas sp. IMCC34011]|uniref:gamma-glutamyl-gamma-aminobutyrate hydrolase family protein n=1 Tax=Tropicimonas sp. IMCC34011 TaxID=2248759 RepID=UPI000E261E5F|nr:gamma-glutamyl-gamma-aminobutyrate hydrolase family protein [Tropicimonas sp. IMCC34011]